MDSLRRRRRRRRRRRSDPQESTIRWNFSITSNFSDGVRSDGLRTILAAYNTLLKENETTHEEMMQKSRKSVLMKPKKYSFSTNPSRLSKEETNSRDPGTTQGTT